MGDVDDVPCGPPPSFRRSDNRRRWACGYTRPSPGVVWGWIVNICFHNPRWLASPGHGPRTRLGLGPGQTARDVDRTDQWRRVVVPKIIYDKELAYKILPPKAELPVYSRPRTPNKWLLADQRGRSVDQRSVPPLLGNKRLREADVSWHQRIGSLPTGQDGARPPFADPCFFCR